MRKPSFGYLNKTNFNIWRKSLQVNKATIFPAKFFAKRCPSPWRCLAIKSWHIYAENEFKIITYGSWSKSAKKKTTTKTSNERSLFFISRYRWLKNWYHLFFLLNSVSTLKWGYSCHLVSIFIPQLPHILSRWRHRTFSFVDNISFLDGMWAAKLPARNGALSWQFLITSTAKGDCNVTLVTDGWLTKNNIQQHFGEEICHSQGQEQQVWWIVAQILIGEYGVTDHEISYDCHSCRDSNVKNGYWIRKGGFKTEGSFPIMSEIRSYVHRNFCVFFWCREKTLVICLASTLKMRSSLTCT